MDTEAPLSLNPSPGAKTTIVTRAMLERSDNAAEAGAAAWTGVLVTQDPSRTSRRCSLTMPTFQKRRTCFDRNAKEMTGRGVGGAIVSAYLA